MPVFSRKKISEGDGIFIRHYLELLVSPAWRGQSLHCRRLIEFLELEHLRHAALENGKLLAPDEQLRAFGIHPRNTKDAKIEAQRRGLVTVTLGQRDGKKAAPFLYRLTYLAAHGMNEFGKACWYPPTHDWKTFTDGNDTYQSVREIDEEEKPNGTFHLERLNPDISGKMVRLKPDREVRQRAEKRRKPPNHAELSDVPNGACFLDSGGDRAAAIEKQTSGGSSAILGPRPKSISTETAFGEQLRSARNRLSLDIKQAGKRAGIGAIWLEKAERGEWEPEPARCQEIISALGGGDARL